MLGDRCRKIDRRLLILHVFCAGRVISSTYVPNALLLSTCRKQQRGLYLRRGRVSAKPSCSFRVGSAFRMTTSRIRWLLRASRRHPRTTRATTVEAFRSASVPQDARCGRPVAKCGMYKSGAGTVVILSRYSTAFYSPRGRAVCFLPRTPSSCCACDCVDPQPPCGTGGDACTTPVWSCVGRCSCCSVGSDAV